MTYFEWNKLIAKHFFNTENAGKDILLYLAKQDIINLAKPYCLSFSDDEIWGDFVSAIKFNGRPSNEIPFSPIARPIELFSTWNKIEYPPPFIAYLILYIIPLTESYEEHFNATNYYGKVNLFFNKYKILNEFTEESIHTGNFQHLTNLWAGLEEWSIITKNCDLGIFELKKFGNPNWIYVGKPLSQCVLPPIAIKKLPELFYEAGMIPNSAYAKEEFKKILIKFGNRFLALKESVIDLVRRSQSNELGETIIEIVKREYSKWTGESHQIDIEGTMHRTRRNCTVVPLILQFKVNDNDGIITFSYRIHSVNEFPEELKFNDTEIIIETNGWSKTLCFEFKESFELRDDFNKWLGRFPFREVRLFISGGSFQLSTGYWIETDSLSRTDWMYLLCKNDKKKLILDWGNLFKNENFIEMDFDGLPENYSLFKILNPPASHPDISILTIYTEKEIRLIGGLLVNFRTFINDYIPEVEILNSDGKEKVYLQYRGTLEKIPLVKKQSLNNRWFLPEDINLALDFFIRAEDEKIARNEVPFNIISSDNSALQVEGIHLPKRDSFGRVAGDILKIYCEGSNVIGCELRRQESYKPLFTSIFEDLSETITTPNYELHTGNMLLGYLTLKSNCTTEDFYRAFEYYYFKLYDKHESDENFNLTVIKKVSINFYDYLGYLDYDYETKKIVVNPPQLIFIPAIMGRKVLLIGGRDNSLISSIISAAHKYRLQVDIIKQIQINENLLLPDAIVIKAFGRRTENYGETQIKAFANELKIKFSQQDFLQVGLQLFSAEISEYEKELFQNCEISQEDYEWARRIFNPETLKYEKYESPTFDRSFSLVEYKLNEYTYYNRLWKDGKCYTVEKNWGRYLALKQFKKHIILFDDRHDRVAIPWEMPLPRLLSESVMLLSGLAPDFRKIDGKSYRVYENIPGMFTENLFHKLGQRPINKDLS